MEDKIEKQLLKEIKTGCKRTGLFTLEGENFLRTCNSSCKYDFKGNLIEMDFCTPEFCATCKLDRLPKLKSKLEQHRKTKSDFIKTIIKFNEKKYGHCKDNCESQEYDAILNLIKYLNSLEETNGNT